MDSDTAMRLAAFAHIRHLLELRDPLSKIHHAAFDAHLIGIDPDYRLHVSPQLLDQNDGPMLEGLKKLQGVSVQLPWRAKGFERFRAAY
jgi:hypothetical protein